MAEASDPKTGSRTIQRVLARYQITGHMRLKSPLAIGAAEGTGALDQIITTDGLGRPIIPGTSLAGVIGYELGRHRPGSGASILFGGSDDHDAASRIVVEDAVIEEVSDGVANSALAGVEERRGVGIDRWSGAAAPGILYNRSVVGAGARLTIKCCVVDDASDSNDKEDMARQLAASIATVLERGFSIGSGTSKGMGCIEPATTAGSVVVHEESFRSRAGLIQVLKGESPKVEFGADESLDAASPRRLEMRLDWHPVSPLMVRANMDGNAVDDLPLVTSAPSGNDAVVFVIPGSSIKGALRSRAEHIVRTLMGLESYGVDSTGPAIRSTDFLDQVQVPLVSQMFGSAAGATATDPHLGRAAIRVHEVTSMAEIPVGMWSRVTAAKSSNDDDRSRTSDLTEAIREIELSVDGINEGELHPATHVAIDRWTGGASDGALFSTLEVRVRNWEPIRISVDLDRLFQSFGGDGNPDSQMHVDAALFLLLLTVRELIDGWIPLGFASHRGQGTIAISTVAISVNDPGVALSGLTGGTEDFRSMDVSKLEKSWTTWLTNGRREGVQ